MTILISSALIKKGVDIAQQYFSLIPDDMVDKIIDQGDIMFCAGGFIIDIGTRCFLLFFRLMSYIDLVQPYLLKQEGTQDSIIGMPMALFNRLYEILLKVEI